MTKNQSSRVFQLLKQTVSKPTTELNYNSKFELLIAVILSARTTDKIVNKITQKLFAIANTPEKIIKLGLSQLKSIIKGSGFFNSKAKNIMTTCSLILNRFNGRIPQTRLELETLPGVGRKTANVVLNIAFGQPTIAVDTHVFRVANRTGMAKGKTPGEIEATLYKIVPPEFAKTAGNLLLLHGRYICRAQRPKCVSCTISKLCAYKFKNYSY
jgi:endonuclease-3